LALRDEDDVDPSFESGEGTFDGTACDSIDSERCGKIDEMTGCGAECDDEERVRRGDSSGLEDSDEGGEDEEELPVGEEGCDIGW
jgi:hypothetical protein